MLCRVACCSPVGTTTMSASAIFVLDLKGKVRLMLEQIVETDNCLFPATRVIKKIPTFNHSIGCLVDILNCCFNCYTLTALASLKFNKELATHSFIGLFLLYFRKHVCHWSNFSKSGHLCLRTCVGLPVPVPSVIAFVSKCFCCYSAWHKHPFLSRQEM